MSAAIKTIELQVIAEGRVVQIDVRAEDAEEIFLLDEREESPVVLRYELTDKEPRSYILLYDHRKASRERFQSTGEEWLGELCRQFQENVPCLCGFRFRKGLYVVLNDIGTADMRDGGEDEKLILTRAGRYNKTEYRVMRSLDGIHDACHMDTGIRLCRPVCKSAE